MHPALIALMAVQAGYSMYSQKKQMDAAKSARKNSMDEAIQNQNDMIKDAARKKREGANSTVLGGTPTGQSASGEGTILSSTDKQRSLLG